MTNSIQKQNIIMDFSDFLKYVPKIKQEKLLAEQAHLKMVPIERILEVEKYTTASNNPRKAAVMMLIYLIALKQQP